MRYLYFERDANLAQYVIEGLIKDGHWLIHWHNFFSDAEQAARNASAEKVELAILGRMTIFPRRQPIYEEQITGILKEWAGDTKILRLGLIKLAGDTLYERYHVALPKFISQL